ncbi:MAG: penicillin-binding protein activator [Pseudomonadota bacterium]
MLKKIKLILLIVIASLLASCASLRSGNTNLAALPDHYAQIALLLPLHGPYARAGKSIREGFLESYYQGQMHGQPPIQIKFYNTQQGNIKQLYQQAVQDGAQLIIGPLQRQNVRRLERAANGKVPVIALNYTKSTSPPRDFFEFGLSPENDAIQVANGAWQDGHRNAIIIAPNNAWGKRISNAFVNTWQALGGQITDGLLYSNNEKLRPVIRSLLDINQSVARANKLEKLLGEKVKFAPRRRADVDMIFLVATPNYARQIVPLVRYNYATQLAIYSISLINTDIPKSNYNLDVNRVKFVDVPFILNGKNYRSHRQLFTNNTNPFQNRARFYALGADTYLLASQLKNISSLPSQGLNGATGKLYLGSSQMILQQLSWAEFRNKRIAKIPS